MAKLRINPKASRLYRKDPSRFNQLLCGLRGPDAGPLGSTILSEIKSTFTAPLRAWFWNIPVDDLTQHFSQSSGVAPPTDTAGWDAMSEAAQKVSDTGRFEGKTINAEVIPSLSHYFAHIRQTIKAIKVAESL